MNIPQSILIDVEITNNVPGYPPQSRDGVQIQYILAGKMICPVPKNEHNNRVYQLLKTNCGMLFCTSDKMDGFSFYPVPTLAIFAVDCKGNRFGTIGGIGGFGRDEFAVGYITESGIHKKLADSFKEFLELVIFYPYWREIIDYEQTQVVYDLSDLQTQQKKYRKKFLENQHELAEIFGLSKNPKSIECLIQNIRGSSDFVVYKTKSEAKKFNTFLEDNDVNHHENIR